jgi:hypothetical protein
MEGKDYLCDHADTCLYGVCIGHEYICDYIGMTGESRFHNGPKGEIINGRCGYYDERAKIGAKNRIAYKSKKRHVL